MRYISLLYILVPSLLLSKSVTFNEILDLTMKNNQELKAKKLDIDKANATLKEVKGSELGVLKFNENITQTNHAGYVFGMKLGAREATFGDFGFDQFLSSTAMQKIVANNAGVTMADSQNLLATQPNNLNNAEARTNYESKLSYDLPIFAGWKIASAKEMMLLQAKANEVKYKFDEKALALEVLKTYNGAVAAKSFISATKKAKDATTSYVNFATELLNEGFVTKIDLKQAQVYDMNINAKMSEATNQLELALAYLRFLSDSTEITDVDNFANFVCKKDANLQAMQELAITQRDDLAWMGYNKETAKSKITFDSADEFPMIGLHAEYGYNDDNLNNIKGSKDYYLIAGGLEYKIFNGFATSMAKQKAKIDFQKASYYHSYMSEGIKLEIEKNYLTLQTKKSVSIEKQKALSLAEEIAIQTEELYKNHLTNMTTLLIQQANLEKARAEAIMATYDETIAAASLKISLGEYLDN